MIERQSMAGCTQRRWWKQSSRWMAAIFCLASALLSQTPPAPPGFSHGKHAPLKISCTICHTGAPTGDRAGFPGQKTCAVCHPKIPAERTAFPTRRAFRLPGYVFFSHKAHLDAKAECARCHGDLSSMPSVFNTVGMKMKFCVDCHKEAKAPAECFACHELGQ